MKASSSAASLSQLESPGKLSNLSLGRRQPSSQQWPPSRKPPPPTTSLVEQPPLHPEMSGQFLSSSSSPQKSVMVNSPPPVAGAWRSHQLTATADQQESISSPRTNDRPPTRRQSSSSAGMEAGRPPPPPPPQQSYPRAAARGALFFRVKPEQPPWAANNSDIPGENRKFSDSLNATPEMSPRKPTADRPPLAAAAIRGGHERRPTPPSTAPTVKKLAAVGPDDSFHASRFSSENNVAALADLRYSFKVSHNTNASRRVATEAH